MDAEAGITAMDGLSMAFPSRMQEWIAERSVTRNNVLNKVHKTFRLYIFRRIILNNFFILLGFVLMKKSSEKSYYNPNF
jgi:hypothetical protein